MFRFSLLLSACSLAFSVPVFAADQIFPDTTDYSDIYNSETYDWSGFYAGISLGYGSGQTIIDGGTGTTVALRGATYGAQAGYAAMYENYVFGIEANVTGSGIQGNQPCQNPAFTCIGNLYATAGIEALAGISVDNILLYGKIGGVYGYGRADTDPIFPGYDFGALGYTVGAGVEYGITENLSGRLEYSYMAFQRINPPVGTINNNPDTLDPSVHLLKVGLNYHF